MRVAIVSPFAHTNALGRALALGELKEPGLDITVYAPQGPVWPGRTAFPRSTLRQCVGRELWGIEADVLWAIKPLPQSLGRSWAIARQRSLPLVLDLDDDDLGLAREFVEQRTFNRFRLARRGDSPRRIVATEQLIPDVDLVTVASDAVAARVLSRTAVYDGLRPTGIQVPHPRDVGDRPIPWPLKAEPLRLGFLGTVRPHKGLELLLEWIGASSGMRLVLLARGVDAVLRRRLETNPVVDVIDKTPREALRAIHAVVLPQTLHGAADVQLPAKFCDALAAGRPVIASPSTAMLEFDSPGILWVDNWRDRVLTDAVVARIREVGADLGRANWELARRSIARPVLARRVKEAFGILVTG